jgi:hypothetical protein
MAGTLRLLVMFAVLTWNGYFLSQHSSVPLSFDLIAITAIVGRLLWHKFGMPHFFAEHPPIVSYFPIAYGMMFTEQLYEALVKNIDEGYTTALYMVRVGQFWAYYAFAFSGVIIALFLLHHYRYMRRAELVVLATLYGIYAEHAYVYLYTKPILFLVFAPIALFIYYFIFEPPLSVLPDKPLRSIHPLVRYTMSVVLILVLSIPFMLIVDSLRTHYPVYFPPSSMIDR